MSPRVPAAALSGLRYVAAALCGGAAALGVAASAERLAASGESKAAAKAAAALESRPDAVLDAGGGDAAVPTGAVVADADAVLVERVEPKYPALAAQDKVKGRVLLRFDIGIDGAVKNPRVLVAEPPEVFDKAAIDAVEHWKYRPALAGGQPVEKRGVRVKLSFEP